jgi:hypothetical protein
MTPTQRQAMEMALEALEQLQGGCTDSDDGTVEAITVWCPEVVEALRAALAEQEAPNELFHVEHRTNACSDVCDASGRVYATCSWNTDAAERAARICNALNGAPMAEQADDKADAERYRWIRENSWSSHIQQGTSSGIHYPTAWHVITGGSDTDIDAAIDAARSKT